MKKIFLLLPLFLVACAKPDSSNLEDVKNREVEVENENLRRKATEMEARLAKQQRLFTALSGTYEGKFIVGTKEYKKRIMLIPSLPPYNAGRSRTLEEITADLNNLTFTVQTTTLNAQTGAGVDQCGLGHVRLSYETGIINAASEGCSTIYIINLYESNGRTDDLLLEKPGVAQKSHDLVQKVYSQELTIINEIFVEMRPAFSAKTHLMVLRRVSEQ